MAGYDVDTDTMYQGGNTKSPLNPKTLRRACFTVYHVNDMKYLMYLKDLVDQDILRYVCVGFEHTKSGQEHLQCYCESSTPKHFKALVNLLSWNGKYGPNVRQAKGTGQQNLEYCSKERLCLNHGKMGQQGKRNDLLEVKVMIDDGATSLDIADIKFGTWCRNRNALKEYKILREQKESQNKKWNEFEAPNVCYLFGESGKGKTFSVFKNYWPYYAKTANNQWWDGFDGQETVLIDDFRGGISLDYILQLLDRYPGKLGQVKGATVSLDKVKTVIITSEKAPEEWYSQFNGETREVQKDQEKQKELVKNLRRRAKLIIDVNKFTAEEIDAMVRNFKISNEYPDATG
jgi:hypothetical protein